MQYRAEELAQLLAWQIDAGADEVMAEHPQNRFEEPERAAWQQTKRAARAPNPPAAAKPAQAMEAAQAIEHEADIETITMQARQQAQGANDLAALEAALAAFEHCELKKGARNTVFFDGNPAASVMIIGEAPGRDEDRIGKPFVGAAGQLLDRMFAAIGLSRGAKEADKALYITNVIPWRPPQNRDPSEEEIAMMLPFIRQHIALKAPKLIVTLGNISTKALLDTKTGITRMRGNWASFEDIPLMPSFHPAALLRNAAYKPLVWQDLLSIKARLEGRE